MIEQKMSDSKLWTQFVDATVLRQTEADSLLMTNPELLSARGLWGETPLHFLVTENYIDGIRYLVAKGADVNLANRYGDTPLMSAALLGYQDIVELLIQAGADPHASHDIHGSALFCAASSGNPKVLESLLRARADPTRIDAFGNTAEASFPEQSRESMLAVWKRYSDGI